MAWGGWLVLSMTSLGCDQVSKISKAARRALGQPSARASAVPPIPSNRTVREDEAQVEAWSRRTMAEAYARLGQKDPRWDAQARELIEDTLVRRTASVGLDDAIRTQALGREAVAAGCSDPLVLYALALVLTDQDPDSPEITFLLERAVEGMKHARYPRAVARYVASGLYRSHGYSRQPMFARKPVADQELKWFLESLQDGSYGPDEDDVLVWQLMNGTGFDLMKRNGTRIKVALEATPWVDEWARLHFSGLWHERQAWAARGHEAAGDVRPEQWKGFRAEIALARRDWVRAWQLRPDRPEPAYGMIGLVTHLPADDETERLWFDRSVAARVDYWNAYSSMEGMLLPRWGGSYEEMLDFGKECLGGGRFDTRVPLFLLETVDDIAKDQQDEVMGAGGPPIYQVPETFTLLAGMLDGYLAAPSPAVHPDRIHLIYAIVAGKAGRYEVARQHLEAVGFRVHPHERWRLTERPDEFVNRLVALGGPAGATLQKAEAAWEKMAHLEALALYRQALAQDRLPQSQSFCRHRIAGLLQEQELAKGGWIGFQPATTQLEGWEVLDGSFRTERDGGLVATSGRRGYLLVSRARVGPDFELTARIEFVSSTNEQFEAGIVFGKPRFDLEEWTALRVFQTASEGNTAFLSQHFYMSWLKPAALAKPNPSELLLKVVGGRMTAVVNGTTVAKDEAPHRRYRGEPDTRVGFGAYLDENQFSVRYRNVRLRRLPPSS